MTAALVLSTLAKLLPINLSHTLYYCQAVLNSLTFKFPHQLRFLLGYGLIIWLFWSVLQLTFTLFRTHFYKNRLQIKRNYPKSVKNIIRSLKLDGKVELINHLKPLAFCLGIWKPKIYLSTTLINLMTDRELTAILLHEKYHLRQRHPLTSVLTSLVQTLLPLLPLVKDLVNHFHLEKELAADTAAVRFMGNSKSLLSALKKLLEQPTPKPLFAFSYINFPQTLELRINQLLTRQNPPVTFSGFRLILSLTSLLLLTGVFLTPIQAVELHTKDQDAILLCTGQSKCTPPCIQSDTKTLQTPTNFTPNH